MKSFRLIPFVCGAGASTAGAEQGPIDLEKYGIDDYLRGLGIDVAWHERPSVLFADKWGADAHKNLPPLGSDQRKQLVFHHCTRLRDSVVQTLSAGCVPITIGGDHSMGAASIAGLAKEKGAHGRIGVLWVDAHADINTPSTSPSQALHGMPVAALLGLGDKDFASLGGDVPVLKPENICYVGLRDVDDGEVNYMKELGVSGFYMKDIKEKGLVKVMREAMAVITKNTDHLFFSMDIDGLDPEYAPATGTAVSGGLNLDDLCHALGGVLADNDFDGFEIAEYNPTLGGKDKTTETICTLLKTLTGAKSSVSMKDVV